MTDLSDRQRHAFANPAKAACREGNLRVSRVAADLTRRRAMALSRERCGPRRSENGG